MSEIPLFIADCQLPTANFSIASPRLDQIGNRQLAIGNVSETPKGGQSAQCPDRFFAKAADSSVNFSGSNASASNTPLT
jgi:hypothetical protein